MVSVCSITAMITFGNQNTYLVVLRTCGFLLLLFHAEG